MLLGFLLKISVGFAALSLFLFFFQNQLIFPGSMFGEGPSKAPADVRETFLDTVDGEKIQTWFKQASSDRGRVAIIFTGNADQLWRAGHFYQGWLAEQGISSLAHSYRGFGKSSGSPSEAALKADAELIYNYVLAEYQPKQILVYAISIGTGPGTWLSLNRPVDELVLLSPYTSLLDVVKSDYVYRFFSFLLRTNFDNLFEIKNAKKLPRMLIVHGEQDKTIPFEQGRKLYQESLGKPGADVSFLGLPGIGHNDIFGAASEDLEAWLARG